MKKTMLIVLLSLSSILGFSQENKDINLLQTDSSWGKEIIKIPFWFAPEINYKGNEDIRFAKGWEDQKSSGFWALAFAWDMNLYKAPTSTFFEENLKYYFDGLMKVVNENEKLKIPKTKAKLSKKGAKKETTTFIGTLETYDAFTTKKAIKLNVIVESFFCKKTNKHIPIFKMAPKGFSHKIWSELNNIKLQKNICNEK